MKKEARERKTSIDTKQYHDMNTLFESWSDDEFEFIQGKIDRERRIDKKLWE